jgi:hypothetical protein
MPKGTGWLPLVGFFGLTAAAGAQAPPSPIASTQFDGTYTLVSSTAGSFSGRAIAGLGQCPEWRPGPLTVSQGRVQWSTPGTGREWEGTVGSHGELAVRLIAQPASFHAVRNLGIEAMGSGIIDHDGTVRVHTVGRLCSWDLVWQKEHK